MSLENNCPDFEELSAWHDKESETDYTSHVADCKDCQSALEDIKKIDCGLSELLTAAQPSEKLKENLLDPASQPTQKDWRILSHVIKLAAILAAAFILNYMTNTQEETLVGNAPAETDNSLKKHKIPVLVAGQSEDTAIEPIIDSSKTTIPEKDFKLVSTNQQKGLTETVEINSTVKHVWVVTDVSIALKNLENQIASMNILEKRMDESGTYHMTIQIKEQELISKVDWLAKQGYNLVSPDYPQPAANLLSENPEKIVTYKISIIKKQ